MSTTFDANNQRELPYEEKILPFV